MQEERDLVGRRGFGGHDQVALVLAVLVVDDHDDLTAADGGDGVRDGGEPGVGGHRGGPWTGAGASAGLEPSTRRSR